MKDLYKPISLVGLFCMLLNGFVCCQSKSISNKSALENQKKSISSQQQKKEDQMVVEPPVLFNRIGSDIGPEDIRVVARILSIKNSSSSLEAPCNQFRCTAEILIEEVIQIGRTYNGNLEVGKKSMAFFPMTIEPTFKVYPTNVNQQVFSGLKLNELFVADVSGSQAIDQAEIGELRILTYKLLK